MQTQFSAKRPLISDCFIFGQKMKGEVDLYENSPIFQIIKKWNGGTCFVSPHLIDYIVRLLIFEQQQNRTTQSDFKDAGQCGAQFDIFLWNNSFHLNENRNLSRNH